MSVSSACANPGQRNVNLRGTLKVALHRGAQFLMLPLALLAWRESSFTERQGEVVFYTCAHLVALRPGLPGGFLRRAFYSLTLDHCSADCHIGFGTLFAHRQASVGDHVYIGSYALFGAVTLGDHTLVGSRASILSGHALHELDDDGRWTPYSHERLQRITVGENVWIGEAAVIAANVGSGAMIGAGSVVTSEIRPSIVVAGNPARFVRKREPEEDAGA